MSATRTYTYHSTGGELCKRTDPETGASFFGYDGASNLLWSAEGTHLTGYNCSSSPPLAERTTRTYDTLNRLKSVTYPSGTNGITYGYKPDGALAWVNTTDGIDWTYEYNRLRLLTSEQTSLEGMTFTHAYTSLGHLSSTRYPHGVTVSHAPNALGQPTRVGSFATAATYHPNGALKSFVYGNQLTRTYTQNTRMLVSGIVDRYSTSAALHDLQHVYDQAGNLTSITDVPGIADRTMAYDYLDRLVTANASSLWGLGRYAYDPLDNLREADIGARRYNYNYATNWRLSNIRTDAGTTVWNFGYDVRGNQTSKGSQSYTFNRANRITAIPGLVSTYFYDGHGRRQAEIRATGHARYTLRTKDGLMRGGPDSTKAAGVWHYYLGRQLVATTTNPHSGATPTTAYQHTDHLGSVIRETGPTRNTISQTYYEPYGQPTNRTVDGPGYTGHVMDAPSGLIYMEQRYYDPLVGRFLSVDPVTTQDGDLRHFARYTYAYSNPYRFADPDGRAGMETMQETMAWGNLNYVKANTLSADDASFGLSIAADAAISIGVDFALGGPSGEAAAVFGALRAAKVADKAADANRAAAKAQGVPDSKIGPSGRPKQHTVDHSTRKAAREAAEHDAPRGGRVRHDAKPQNPKQRQHFQAEDAKGQNAKPVRHHEYPSRFK